MRSILILSICFVVVLTLITLVLLIYLESNKKVLERIKSYLEGLYSYEKLSNSTQNASNYSRILLYINENNRYLKIATNSRPPLIKLPPQPNCGNPESIMNFFNIDRAREQQIMIQQKQGGRIINGLDTLPFNWPWMASLKMIKVNPTNLSSFTVLEHFCAGSLIYENFVITAAHCVKSLKKENFIVSMGLNDLNDKSIHVTQNLYKVEKVFIVDKFVESNILNDIALIKLERKVTLNRYVATICLPDSPKQADFVYSKSVIVTGWGGNGKLLEADSDLKINKPIKPRKLQQTILKVINGNSLCDKYCNVFNATSHYCAFDSQYNGMTNVCIGDSGGPMFIYKDGRYYLFGVVSFVITYLDLNLNVKCFTQAPSYFSKVPLYLEWIAAKVNENM